MKNGDGVGRVDTRGERSLNRRVGESHLVGRSGVPNEVQRRWDARRNGDRQPGPSGHHPHPRVSEGPGGPFKEETPKTKTLNVEGEPRRRRRDPATILTVLLRPGKDTADGSTPTGAGWGTREKHSLDGPQPGGKEEVDHRLRTTVFKVHWVGRLDRASRPNPVQSPSSEVGVYRD